MFARTEADEDLARYMNACQMDVVVCNNSDLMNRADDVLREVYHPSMERLVEWGVLYRGNSIKDMNHFRLQAMLEAIDNRLAQGEVNNATKGTMVGHAYTFFALSRAHEALSTNGIGALASWVRAHMANTPKNSADGAMRKTAAWRALRAMCDTNAGSADLLARSPKLVALSATLVEHFQRFAAAGKSTRAMVFAEKRDAINEIVAVLAAHAPLIAARPFTGQGLSSTGGKGQTQREQIALVAKFRAGEYNVLVSTSTGEEGMDIGEVDLLVLYDATASPTRATQRIGRTGRKRTGRVVMLVSPGKEQSKLRSASDKTVTIARIMKTQVAQLQLYPYVRPPARD